jgi:hypothetical protein
MKQIMPSAICPGIKRKSPQRGSALSAPELLLLLYSLVEHEMLQFVFDARAYLDQLVAMNQQLTMIPHLRSRNPDARKASFDQELQNVSSISTIRLLLPNIAGTNLGRISDPHLVDPIAATAEQTTDRCRPFRCPRAQARSALDRIAPLHPTCASACAPSSYHTQYRAWQSAESLDGNHNL